MPYPTSLPRDVERTVFLLLEDLATPVSLGVYLRVKYGCWDDLAACKVVPKHYYDFGDFCQPKLLRTADRYWRDAMAINQLRKLEELPTTIDRKAVAEKLFIESERECFRSNERLSPYLYGADPSGFNHTCDKAVSQLLDETAKRIRNVLGQFHDDRNVIGRFGPGSTFGDRGQLITVPDKMSSRPTLTPSALGYLFPWSSTAWARACASDGRDPLFVRGNRFTSVPKDSTKERGICIEPSINLFYQLALGQTMKNRLKRTGINLEIGKEIHMQVARDASVKGHLSTIDLSNASDTVSANLVKLVVPTAWYEAFSSLRSSHTLFKNQWWKLEKFSSMGNGFTFELETLIFLGICLAVGSFQGVELTPGVDLFVYGDDIIVPTSISQDVIAALRVLGFTPNPRKTFVDGYFRESCGGDFFDGVDVRPHYLKGLPDEPQHFIAWANGLRSMADSVIDRWSSNSPLRRAWFSVLDALPSHLRRLRGPKDLGDLVIHDDKERWNIRWRYSIRYIRCYRPARFKRVGWEHFKPDVMLACATYGVPSGSEGGIPRGAGTTVKPGGVTPREAVMGYKVGWVARS